MTLRTNWIALALPFAFLACGGGTPEAEAPATESTEAPASEASESSESTESSEPAAETPAEGSEDAPAP